MARIFGNLLGKGRALTKARAAELRGELAQAAALFAYAGRPDEAARVMLLRGDAEPELAQRLRHYVLALATAPIGSGVAAHARRKHASAIIAMAGESPLTALVRDDLVRAARELETVGDHAHAALAYARAGDIGGQARALARGGEVDALDALLGEDLLRSRAANARRQAHDDMSLLIATGRRREAAALAGASDDEALRERGRAIECARVAGNIVQAVVRGKDVAIVLGNEVVIGRTPENAASAMAGPSIGGSEGAIAVVSPTVSRRHVAIGRQDGQVVVRDLGSRKSTTLRGAALVGDAIVGDGLELTLGRDVPLVVRPTDEIEGAVAIEVASQRYVAPLGPAMLGVGRWRLDRGADGWVELATSDDPSAFVGRLQMRERITLVMGDAISVERGGEPALTMRRP